MGNKMCREQDIIAEWMEKECGVDAQEVPEEVVEFFREGARELLENKELDKKEYKKVLDAMGMSELSVFIPDVYQKKIEDIDYGKLKENGIRLISFDIDDTIGDVLEHNIKLRLPYVSVTMHEDAKKHFRKLRDMGFIVVLLTNAPEGIAKGTNESLKTDGYIARAKKPRTDAFRILRDRYGMNGFEEMAHVGNSMRDDIVGGNKAGVTTCLVRRRGVSLKFGKMVKGLFGQKTAGHIIREKLKEYGMWHKHHVNREGDQYYQIGEVQTYSPNFRLYECTKQNEV